MDSLHSVIATANEELIVFFDSVDMHVIDMRTASMDSKVHGFRVQST